MEKLNLISVDNHTFKVGEILLLEDGEYEDREIIETYQALKEFDICEIENQFRETVDLTSYLTWRPWKYELYLEHKGNNKGGYEFNYQDYIDDFIRFLLKEKYMKRIDHSTFCFDKYNGLDEFIKEHESKYYEDNPE